VCRDACVTSPYISIRFLLVAGEGCRLHVEATIRRPLKEVTLIVAMGAFEAFRSQTVRVKVAVNPSRCRAPPHFSLSLDQWFPKWAVPPPWE
jgi:hypothetical protein